MKEKTSKKENKDKKEDKILLETEKLKESLVNAENQLAKERACLLNYQKDELDRATKRTEYYEKCLLLELISIIDNFEHTVQSLAKQKTEQNKNILLGVEMIYKQFKNFLAQKNCQSYDSLNQTFNPSLHEAIESVVSKEFPDNTISEEIQKGYTYKDQVLRPAKVRVVENKVLENNN